VRAPFKTIKVSNVILLLALSEEIRALEESIRETLKEAAGSVDWDVFRNQLGEFSERSAQTVRSLRNIRTISDADAEETHQFFFSTLPQVSRKIKSILNNNGQKKYIPAFQALGDNIRRSGCAVSNANNPENLLVLPENIAHIIKLARLRNRAFSERRNYFVIDALRHPFEIRYLRERIQPFYLMAITTDDSHRKSRLHELNYRNDEIQSLDYKKYASEASDGRKFTGYSKFVSLDIQACLALADVLR